MSIVLPCAGLLTRCFIAERGELMKIAGIVCEYNPMHNGHVYHLEKTREAGATHIVCALSADFVQRGECAYLDKFTRADIAVHCGADLVVEIPVVWSSGAAESYALGAVSILDSLGCDFLSFGTETDDKKLLSDCAGIFENEEANRLIRRFLSEGNSYPASVAKAAECIYGKTAADVFSSPNSTLALEYIRTLGKLGSRMEFLPVKRFGAAHDSEKADGITASASYLRSLEDIRSIKSFIPTYAYEKLMEKVGEGKAPCTLKNGESVVLSYLRRLSLEDIKRITGDNSGLSERIYEAVKTSCSLEELFFTVKTKAFTLARIRRSVIQLFLEIPLEKTKETPPYIRVLAANRKGLEILKNATDKIPVVTRHSDILKLDERAKEIYEISCQAADQYAFFGQKTGACLSEQTSPVKIFR